MTITTRICIPPFHDPWKWKGHKCYRLYTSDKDFDPIVRVTIQRRGKRIRRGYKKIGKWEKFSFKLLTTPCPAFAKALGGYRTPWDKIAPDGKVFRFKRINHEKEDAKNTNV